MSSKRALIIANTDYADPKLAKLAAPSKDAEAFAEILKAPDLAAFDEVTTVINQSEPVARRAMAKFFIDRQPDDLLLLYFSGHGVRDDQGRLFLAMTDTDSSMLDATAVPSEFITRQMDNSRSRRQLLILDCCNSGAFASGTKSATQASMGTGGAFEGTGYGRVVLTATDATQFAWEGDKIIGEGASNSLFTHFLVKGLEGEADSNGDGKITVDELYDYAYGEIVKRTPKQTPGKWTYREQGQIVLTSRVRPQTVKPMPLDPDLELDLQSTRNYIREAAVNELGNILQGPNLGRALSAELRLKQIAENDDSRVIARKAAQLLEQQRPNRSIAVELENSALASAGQASTIGPETLSEQSARGGTHPQLLAKADNTLSDVLQPPQSGSLPASPGWRRYASVAAIGLVVLGMLGAVWRAVIPGMSPSASQSTQQSISISGESTSTITSPALSAASNISHQPGIWSIDYFPSIQLNGPAVFQMDIPAQQNAEGGYTLQFRTADLHSNPEVPSSNLSVRLAGLFYFAGGTYDFHCEHRDGCRVYVDDENWIDAWLDGSGSHDIARVVSAGSHIVRVEFYDKSGQGSLQVLWNIKQPETPTPAVTITAIIGPTKQPTAIPTPTRKKKETQGGICLAFDTMIDTPGGPIPVQDLRIGDLVWSRDTRGRRIAVPITRTRQAEVPPDAKLLHLILTDGRDVRVSPAHPAADGRPVGELRPGDWLDGAQVGGVESFLYTYSHTYDILPAGANGVYWADGILLGSTLKYDPVP